MYLVTSLSAADVRNIVTALALDVYADADAITVELDHVATITRGANAGRHRYRVKLGALDSHSPAARRSWSGRRGPWLCWHGFRDAFAAWLLADPRAIISTGLETYRGARGFLDLFPATGAQNVGSVMQPATLTELCDCEPGATSSYVSALVDLVDAEMTTTAAAI